MNKELIEVALGKRMANLYITGGKLINVYSGEIYPANIAVYRDKIAYVGLREGMIGPETQIISAHGFYLAPGYIEPHSHPWTIFNPLSLMEASIPLGTTVSVSDNFALILNLGNKGFLKMAEELFDWPMRYFWSARAVFSSHINGEEEILSPENVAEVFDYPAVLAMAELSNWSSLIDNQNKIWDKLARAFAQGKRIEGHTAGASNEKLNALVDSGIHCCHEAITSQQVQERLRLGLWVMLRHSSLRPDLPELIKAITELGLDHRKMMLTTDGSTPDFVHAEKCLPGMLNYLVAKGVNPVTALQLATVNPATFYSIEHQYGGIAPGRRADILFLPSLDQFVPAKVIANGHLVAEEGHWTVPLPKVNWEGLGFQKSFKQEININNPALYVINSTKNEEIFPVMEMENAVITRRKDLKIPVTNGKLDICEIPDLISVSLIDKEGQWVTKGVLQGFGGKIDGLASTYSNSNHLVVMGTNPSDMIKAAQQIIEWDGGIALMEKGQLVTGFPLPLGGLMSNLSYQQIVPLVKEFSQQVASRGYNFNEVFYTLLFLTHTYLPDLRLTAKGLVQVKNNTVIMPREVL